MIASPLLAVAIGGLLAWVHAEALLAAAPLLGLWLFRPGACPMGKPSPALPRAASLRSDRKSAAAARAQDLALLRRIRRTERSVVAGRQLPGRPTRADGPSNVADEHRTDAPRDDVGLRLRLHRSKRAIPPPAKSVRQHQAPSLTTRDIFSTGTIRRTCSRFCRGTCRRSTAAISQGASSR
jgi:hypothetical protein